MTRKLERLVLLTFIVATGGCDRGTPVGLPCNMGADGGTSQVLILQSPECAGRYCMEIGQAPARCTATCATEEDCAGQSAGPKPCRSGFLCAVGNTVGPQACQRFCICRDDLPAAWADETERCGLL